MSRMEMDGGWTDEDAQRWQGTRVRALWSDVAVDPVEVVPWRGGWRVHAVVRLGGLVPADVRVELVNAGPPPGGDSAPWSLWASQSYGNGCYVFEAPVPPDDAFGDAFGYTFDDARRTREWLLRVRPAESLAVEAVECTVRLGARAVGPLPPSPRARGATRASA